MMKGALENVEVLLFFFCFISVFWTAGMEGRGGGVWFLPLVTSPRPPFCLQLGWKWDHLNYAYRDHLWRGVPCLPRGIWIIALSRTPPNQHSSPQPKKGGVCVCVYDKSGVKTHATGTNLKMKNTWRHSFT